jgi:hypothetical protein
MGEKLPAEGHDDQPNRLQDPYLIRQTLGKLLPLDPFIALIQD